MSKTVITYGTFDLFHIGHLRLLQRLRALGDRLIVGVSTDEFNALKNKTSSICFEDRIEIISGLKCVDMVIPENDWQQKKRDIEKYSADILGMGEDWQGKFDHLSSECEVVYLPRTTGISSTKIKQNLSILGPEHREEFKKALEVISNLVDNLS